MYRSILDVLLVRTYVCVSFGVGNFIMYVCTYLCRCVFCALVKIPINFVDCFTDCLLFVSQRTPGYDLPARKCTEESRCEER